MDTVSGLERTILYQAKRLRELEEARTYWQSRYNDMYDKAKELEKQIEAQNEDNK